METQAQGLLLRLHQSPSPAHCLLLVNFMPQRSNLQCLSWLMLLGCIKKSLRGQTPPLGQAPPSQAFPSCPWPSGLFSGADPAPMTHIRRGLSRRKWAHYSFPNEVSVWLRRLHPFSEVLTHTPPLTLTPKQKLRSRKYPVSMLSIQGSRDIQSFSILSLSLLSSSQNTFCWS